MTGVMDVKTGLITAAALLTGATAISGCVQVNAPNEPIVINLNINIRQEIVYRLDSSARELIEQEAEIF
jgi:hypothetical protein